jgi:amino acid transporter
MSGYLGWVAGATDNAIYPVLFLDYVLQAFWSSTKDDDQGELHPILRFLLLSITSIGLAYVNWLGLPLVGKMSVSICFVAMSPFIILTIVGAFKVDPSRWMQMPDQNSTAVEEMFDDDHITSGMLPIPGATLGGVLWRPFLNNLFWNLNSFDAAGSFAADVENPGQVLPRAMMWGVFLVASGYLVPLLVALGASDASQEEWVDGYLATACSNIVGPWLGAWTVFAAGISNIALFQAELSADAFQLMGMADRGYLPKILGKRSRHGTPTYGIMIGTAIIVVMGVSDLEGLIEMLNFNYAVALLMEYAAFIKLRISRPDLDRPWRVPLNTFGCIIFLIPTFFFVLLVMALATSGTYIFCAATNIVGVGMYMARKSNTRCCWTKDTLKKLTRHKSYDPVGTDSSLDSTSGTTQSPPIDVADDEASSVYSLPTVS